MTFGIRARLYGNRANSLLNEIVGSIKQVAEIVAASAEQAEGLEQINKALARTDEVTQQNSALVEQNAAAAKTLEHQSTAMDERVGFFRIEPDQEAAKKSAGRSGTNAAAA